MSTAGSFVPTHEPTDPLKTTSPTETPPTQRPTSWPIPWQPARRRCRRCRAYALTLYVVVGRSAERFRVIRRPARPDFRELAEGRV